MLRKERRSTKRLPIRLDVELKPVSVHRNGAQTGASVHTHITNVGPGGVQVNLPAEVAPGTRFWASTRINGKRVEFYAIVRHISIIVTGTTPIYAHGLQITAALADVMDEFDILIKRFAKSDPAQIAAVTSAATTEKTSLGQLGSKPGPTQLAN